MQLVLDADPVQDQRQRCSNQTENHGRQPHLRLADAAIPPREIVGQAVAQVSARGDAEQGPDARGNEAQADLPRLEPVGFRESRVDVGRDGDQETDGDGLDQGRPEHGRQADEPQRPHEEFQEGLRSVGAIEKGEGLQVGLPLVWPVRVGGMLDIRKKRLVSLAGASGRTAGGSLEVVALRGCGEFLLAVERRLWEGKERQYEDETNKGTGHLVHDTPVVVNGD